MDRRPGRSRRARALLLGPLLVLVGCAVPGPDRAPDDLDPTGAGASEAAPPPDPDLLPCPPRTRDLGLHATYAGGVRERARLCAVPGLASTGRESTPGSVHYLSGARGRAIVHTGAAGAVLRLSRAAARAGVTLSATSSFRTQAHQRALCRDDAGCRDGDHLLVAPPGWSNHQSGVAIDVAGTRVVGAQSCGRRRAEDPGSPVWTFMETIGRELGFVQYAAESWHWELAAPAAPDRC